jgi:hypothetical protein
MSGINLLDKICNVEILWHCNVLSIAYIINQQRMWWLNHLARMEPSKLLKQIFQGKLLENKRGWGRPPTSIQKRFRDDVASMSTTGGGHFHVIREGHHTFWDNTQNKEVWKGLINATWAGASRASCSLMGTQV